MPSQNLPDFDSLWDYSHPDESEAKFRGVLQEIPTENPVCFELLTQIARAQGLQRKFDEAHQTLDQVEKQMEEKPSRVHIRYHLERGRVFNSWGDPERARSCFQHAFDLAKELSEDFYAVDALHMLAIVAPPASGLDLNLQAIQLAEQSTQEKARNWLGSLYNNTGWSYHDIGDYESALRLFEKGEAWQRSNGRAAETRTAAWTVARTLRSLARVEEALDRQIALKAELDATGANDGYVMEEIGECLLTLKREEEARPFFAQAYKALGQDPWLTEQEPDRLARLKQLGEG